MCNEAGDTERSPEIEGGAADGVDGVQLCRLLRQRLADRAEGIPYAESAVDRFGRPRSTVTVAELIVDATCLYAMKGNPTVIRTLWERVEGKLPDAPAPEDSEPRLIRAPLKGPDDPPPTGPGDA